MDAGWLQQRLTEHPASGDHAADVVPVEVGEDAASYYRGHLPGAVVLDWLDDLHDPHRRGLPSQEQFEELLGSRGIARTTHVVLYGDSDNAFAAYAYWLFRYYQHARVSLLDGGRRAWSDAGGRLTTELPARPRVVYRSPGPDREIRVVRDLLLERYVGAPVGTALLDCRSPEQFRGAPDSAVDLPLLGHRLTGHIPGAHNLPYSSMLDPETGCFRDLDRIRDAFRTAGVEPGGAGTDAVVYCAVGGQSSIIWFVLHELLGHPHTRNYDGGWAEYGSLVDAPVAR